MLVGGDDVRALVFNGGSSSLTYKVFQSGGSGEPQAILAGKAHRVGVTGSEPSHLDNEFHGEVTRDEVPIPDHAVAASLALESIRSRGIEVDCVGHRFVHGGSHFRRSALITDEVLAKLRQCLPLAPLHNPIALSVIEESRRALPGVPMYVCIDSAFHSTIPPHAHVYALPERIRRRFGFRRFGFHGLSYLHVTGETAHLLGRPVEGLRIVACHLGTGGSSVAAIDGGRSVDTSMGASPLPGLVMSTRSGDIDPMLALHLMTVWGFHPDDLLDLLNRRSGLLGISGFSSDISDIVRGLDGEDWERAELAFRMYVHRLRKYIGGYILALGGIDALVFTDDIGNRNWLLRERVCEDMDWCGLTLDRRANRRMVGGELTDLRAEGSRVAVLKIPTEEELVIFREGLSLMEVSECC